jgi:hypothetical protein
MTTLFEFKNLTPAVRARMVAEIRLADAENRLYRSKRFEPVGEQGWMDILIQAATEQNEHWLAHQAEQLGFFKDEEIKRKPKGGYTVAWVPHTASETLSDCEFNRYYMIAVCQEAASRVRNTVTVYRAKQRGEPRPESQALVGTSYEPNALILELQKPPSGRPHPLLQPNSGLSIFFTE